MSLRTHAVLVIALAGLLTLAGCRQQTAQTAPSLADVRAALADGNFERAEELSSRISTTSADWIAATTAVAEAAGKSSRTDEAVRLYRLLAQQQLKLGEPPLGLFYAGEAQRGACRLMEAESQYRQFLTHVPDNALTHERLAFLTSVSGRRWESVPHYWALVRSGTAEVHELALFADLDRPVEQRPYLEDCLRKSPEDRIVQLGLAAHALWEGRTADARTRLEATVATAPEGIAGQALLGELLVNQQDRVFLDWHRRLPSHADDDPDIWYVRGLWARRHDQLCVAARCFWQSVKLAPTHRRATYQLGQVLTTLGEEAGPAFAHRAKLLIELTQAIDGVLRTESQHEEPFRATAELLEQMGRIWETCAWSLAARQRFPQAEWPGEMFSRWAQRLNGELPITLPTENLALKYDLSAYPDFAQAVASVQQAQPEQPGGAPSSIAFAEASAGIDFTYFNGSDPLTEEIVDPAERQRAAAAEVRVRIRTRMRSRIFEQNGGGVAVLDFDGDRRPDLFFTQGAVWKHGSAGPTFDDVLTDRLYRNHQGREFVDVSAQVGIVDRGYGQGCAVGDVDNDGFPDLYIANIGRNQLYRNNGDGTFADITAASGILGEDWTASCVIVDLNADGHPDLYDVNYLTGPQVYEAICQGHTCSPKVFAAAPDRLHLSRGDGTFESVHPLGDERDGKGLGVVAFDVYERGRPSLFVANDQVPNFLLRMTTADDRFHIRLTDEAFVGGVAFNQDGLAMASMGVAADDVNGDGRVDLYVSTFKDEAGMLFVQDAPGMFVESANSAGLRGPTWSFVGWGTQFLDADLDGEVDLVGVNGHVDDYREEGGEYHMRPQFFQNVGAAQFRELSGPDLGAYFHEKRLGRGLSRLDWNGDGRMDFAVSHINDRAALVTNVSEHTGHYVNVRLHARTTARDAIGSVVEVSTPRRRWSKQLVAGDGYMASNERLLQFGLGSAEVVTQLRVVWPSGQTTTVEQVPVDATLELVEGTPRGILNRGSADESTVVEAVLGAVE